MPGIIIEDALTTGSVERVMEIVSFSRLTVMSKGNLSNHLSKLEEAGLVSIEKKFVGKKGVTTTVLTETGLFETTEHWRARGRINAISEGTEALKRKR